MYPRRVFHYCAESDRRNVTPVTRGGGPCGHEGHMGDQPMPSSEGSRRGATTPRDVCRHPELAAAAQPKPTVAQYPRCFSYLPVATCTKESGPYWAAPLHALWSYSTTVPE